MTMVAVQTGRSELAPLPQPGTTPAAIVAALHPGERAEFAADFHAALVEAGRSFDLSPLTGLVEHWRLRAWVTRDEGAFRGAVRRAVALLTGTEPPTDEPVAVTAHRACGAELHLPAGKDIPLRGQPFRHDHPTCAIRMSMVAPTKVAMFVVLQDSGRVERLLVQRSTTNAER